MPETPILETPRLVLRPPRPDDAPALTRAIGDLAVSRWLIRVPYPYSLDDARRFLAQTAAAATGTVWIIEARGSVIGGIGLNPDLGYWLAKDHWGRGLATEAARAVLRHRFGDPGAPPLEAHRHPANTASARVLAKLGFSETGERVRARRVDGTETELVRLWLTPEQWHALNPWTIETPRLRLRPLDQSDVPDIARICGDPRVAPMIFAATVPWPECEAARFVETYRWRGQVRCRFGIVRDGALVGKIGLGVPKAQNAPELAYALAPEVWGQGLMSEALAAFLPAAFARFGLRAMIADAFDDNPASQTLLRRFGFRKTGTGLGTSRARLEPAPVSVYRLSLTDLPAEPRR